MDTEIGFVQSVRDFLVYLDGLPSARINDIVENEQGVRGWVNNLLPNETEVLLLDEGEIQPGQVFKKMGQRVTVPVGEFLVGRAVNPLGVPIDGKGPLTQAISDTLSELDGPAPGINKREFISHQLTTGITLIDTLMPLGKGQRELVLGDARSGKIDFLVDLIVNQKNTGVVCVYASIGKPIAEVRSAIDTLRLNHALPHTVVIAASSTDTAPLIFLTPKTALTIAEYFQKQGKDVLLILDDMGSHAKIYREISLLSNLPPGRESYPGDIFYQHAHLLERAGNFNKESGGGSITAIPVIELNLNDFTTFIPTNLMGMTDGHLLFKASLYNQAQRPAIDLSLSVTRVGGQTQERIQNQLATRLKQVLEQATQLETVSRFSFELPVATRAILKQNELIHEITRQTSLTFIPREVQVILLCLTFTSFLLNKSQEFVETNRHKMIDLFLQNPELKTITKSVFEFKSLDELITKLESLASKLDQLLPIDEQNSLSDEQPSKSEPTKPT